MAIARKPSRERPNRFSGSPGSAKKLISISFQLKFLTVALALVLMQACHEMWHQRQITNLAKSKAKKPFLGRQLVSLVAVVLWAIIFKIHAQADKNVSAGLANQISTASGLLARADGSAGKISGELKEVEGELEGIVTSVEQAASGELEIELIEGTNCFSVLVADSSNLVPSLYSRVRVAGTFLIASPNPDRQSREQLRLADLRQLHLVTGQMCLLVTNAAQFAQIQVAGFPKNLVVHLNGQILAVSPGREFLAFQDTSGTTSLDLGVRNHELQAGRKVRLWSNAVIDNGRVVLRDPPVVNNDGYHTSFQKSGVIYLKVGKRPIRLAWFNWLGPSSLDVFYQGPGLPQQKIPDSALFSHWTDPATGITRWTNGVDYSSAEGRWFQVPDFCHLLTVIKGRSRNFTLEVKSRAENVSIQFNGYIEVPRDGSYNFSTVSDDGSLLYVDEHPPRIELGDPAAIPEARPIVVGQPLRPEEQFQWATVEGVVTFVSEQADSLTLDLSSSSGTMRVEVADSSGICQSLLAHARIRAFGVSQPTRSSDGVGQSVAGILLTPGLEQIEFLELPAARWDDTPLMRISDCIATNSLLATQAIVHVKGRVRMDSPGESVVIDDGTGQVRLATTQIFRAKNNDLVEVVGCRRVSGTNVLLQCVFYREFPRVPDDGAKRLPRLNSADQVKRLTRAEAQLGYPVKLQGVVTAVLDTSFFLRDSTGGIYSRWRPSSFDHDLRMGDSWEIEGVTSAEFSPYVAVARATFLSRGNLPEPLRPSWDRLWNGSLDTEYVEVQGVVIEIESNLLTLFTTSGRIRVQMLDMQPQLLAHCLNALVRIRGCVNVGRDIVTQQIDFGQIGLFNSQISVEEEAPTHLFDLPLKRASELLYYDYRAAAFHRVRIAGQILHESHGTCFLLDGTNSLRFVSANGAAKVKLEIGDQVEVVGFPELGDRSPVLREAVARRMGHEALAPALPLEEATLWNKKYDGRRVSIQARLINSETDRPEQILELQVGSRRFNCRLEMRRGKLPQITPDSTVEVTGIYAAQGGDISSTPEINSFELLLNSPTDVQILTRPSWWTLRHTLTILGVTAPVVLIAFVWIFVLRRQVEKRTRQLAVEIQRHEQTERQRDIEAERSRIARDLHDALGAALTQIRFLSIRGSRASQMPEKSRAQMLRISEKSLEMVSALDEIVWAVNPANDSLDKLVPYLCHIAEDFFSSSTIHCRLDVDENFSSAPLTAEVRHDLYLAVREALNNIAKHSQATEVWFRINWHNHAIRITIEDNGLGFLLSDPSNGDGLANIHHRLEKIGGHFECETHPGTGTVCRLWLPLEPKAEPQKTIPKR